MKSNIRRKHAKHPIQPVVKDKHGTLRFKQNSIVRFLLDAGPFDLNQLARMKFPDEDWEHFAQLLGYSVSGFSDLSYVSDEVRKAVKRDTMGEANGRTSRV